MSGGLTDFDAGKLLGKIVAQLETLNEKVSHIDVSLNAHIKEIHNKVDRIEDGLTEKVDGLERREIERRGAIKGITVVAATVGAFISSGIGWALQIFSKP